MKEPLIIFDHIFLTRGRRTILSDINLTISRGEHWALLGPNGSGKTTLTNIVTAYIWPTDGTVTVLGDRYGTVDIREKRRHIGLVSSALFERIPAGETLLDVIISGRYGSLGIYAEPDEDDVLRAREIAAFLALILKDGAVLAEGPKETVITSENLSAAMDVDIEIISRNGRLFALVR